MLVTWIREVANEPLLLDGDVYAEAERNTWSLSLAENETPSVDEVVAAFEETARLLGARAAATGKSATFYVWHDVQAGHLRCSTSSQPRDRLPFAATADPDIPLLWIVGSYLTDDGGVHIPDLLDDDFDQPEVDYLVPVWAVSIGVST